MCMLYFHNRIRVLNHVKYRSHVCRVNLLLGGPVLSPPEAIAMDEEARELRRSLYAKGLRAHSATAPVFRLTGPFQTTWSKVIIMSWVGVVATYVSYLVASHL